MDATNREADTLRHALLAQWAEHPAAGGLVDELQSLDRSDPSGAEGVEGRLAIWFSLANGGDGRLVAEDDPVLTGLSPELRGRLAAVTLPERDGGAPPGTSVSPTT